jgi:hypothetical protein
MVHDHEAEQWKSKAARAEMQASKASSKVDFETWLEIARIYRELAAKRESGAETWGPRSARAGNENNERRYNAVGEDLLYAPDVPCSLMHFWT